MPNYSLYNPSQGAPKIGQPILYNVSGEPVILPWAGNEPAGYSRITQQEGLGLLQAKLANNQKAQAGFQTGSKGYRNVGNSIVYNNQQIADLQSFSGSFTPKTDEVLASRFNPDSTSLTPVNFTPQAKAEYVSPASQGFAGGKYVGNGDLGPESDRVLAEANKLLFGGVPQSNGQAYSVQAGDTLSKIAQKMGVNVSDISGYSSGNPNLIYPGENLTIKKTNTVTPTGAIGVDGLSANNTLATFPNAPTSNVNGNALIAGGMAGFAPSGTAKPTGTTDLNALFTKYFPAEPASSADAYASAQNASGITEKSQTVRNIEAQLASAVAEAQQATLTLESQAGGKDVTSAFLGRQQQEIGRQSAIRVLPIQAELAAAQGNLQFAQQQLDTVFKLKSQDIQNNYTYRKELFNTLMGVASDQQKEQLRAKEKSEDRAFELKKLETSNTYAKELLKLKDLAGGSGSGGSKILSVTEAQALGLPYGTTEADAMKKGITPATTNKIQASPENKAITAILPAIQSIKAYKDAITKYGTREFISGEGSGTISGTYGNALATWKTLAGLGALSGADFTLAENAIPEKGFFKRSSTSQSKLDTSIKNAVEQAENLTNKLIRTYPSESVLLSSQLDDIKVIAYPERFKKGADGLVYELTN